MAHYTPKRFLKFSRRAKQLIPIFGIGLLLCAGVIYYKASHKSQPSGEALVLEQSGQTLQTGQDYPEVKDQPWSSWQFPDLKGYLQKLAKEKGGAYAYEVLRRAPIAANTDFHLLGHVVGDELYKQEGVDGMRVCTQDFRNACSHSIVVGLFSDYGEDALPKITEACQKAPGGSGAYTMCFHGLGHGILSAVGYELPKGVEICQRIGTILKSSSESTECIGGAIMEIMGGGDHDHDLWTRVRAKYVSFAQPLKPCSTAIIPDEAKGICYIYLTPHLFQAAGADLAKPGAEHFKKAFPFCNSIPKSDLRSRDACYGGFGKEFTVLAQDRDIRQSSIENVSDDKLKLVYDWCALADNKEGSAACIVHAVNSLYWGGENNRSVAIRFCNMITDQYYQGSCVTNLIGAVQHFKQDQEYRKAFCSEIPPAFREGCEKQLLIKQS